MFRHVRESKCTSLLHIWGLQWYVQNCKAQQQSRKGSTAHLRLVRMIPRLHSPYVLSSNMFELQFSSYHPKTPLPSFSLSLSLTGCSSIRLRTMLSCSGTALWLTPQSSRQRKAWYSDCKVSAFSNSYINTLWSPSTLCVCLCHSVIRNHLIPDWNRAQWMDSLCNLATAG